jgi:hypothetical protein
MNNQIVANIWTSTNLMIADHIGPEDYFIRNDEDFDKLEKIAKSSKVKCCIQWQRADDGQTAYWGPKGAQLKPYFYNN